MFGCSECDYRTKYSTTIQNHIESKHISTSGFYCKYCQRFCPTREGLNNYVMESFNTGWNYPFVSLYQLVLIYPELLEMPWNLMLPRTIEFKSFCFGMFRFGFSDQVKHEQNIWGLLEVRILWKSVSSENQHFRTHWGDSCWDSWLLLWYLPSHLSNSWGLENSQA